MKIVADDVSCSVMNPKENARAIAIIRDLCRAMPKDYRFMPKYRSGMWDGYISLMHSWCKFPTGLLPMVKTRLEAMGYSIEVVRSEPKPYRYVTPDFLEGILLRGYQIDAANRLLAAERGIAKMATNAGKTEIMAAIAKAVDGKAIILLHRKELLHQTADRIEERLGGDTASRKYTGIIGDGAWEIGNKVTVAMIQSLSRKIDNLDLRGNTLLMVDECHNASADRMMDVLKAIPGPFRFGFSGTPLKYDLLSDMKLISATGDVVVDVDNSYLIEHGYSATPLVRIYAIESDSQELWELEYHDAYKELIVNNDNRNRRIAELAGKSTGTTLVLVNQVAHGVNLYELIPGATFVHGSDPSEYRRETLEKMRNGGGIYIASPIFDEGVDVPGIDTLILAGGGKSHVKLLQRIGRGLRKKGGNNQLIVYDFLDDTNLYLLQHSEQRIDTYAKEGFKTKVVS